MRNCYNEILNEEHKSNLFDSAKVREIFLDIMKVYNPYKDSIFDTEIQGEYDRFHQRFFEAYLSYTFMKYGYSISSLDSGPDIRIDDSIFVECTAATTGNKESLDRVHSKIYNVDKAQIVPADKLMLRLANVFISKTKRYRTYIYKSMIPFGINIIAISGALLGWQEDNIPRIVKLLYGIGSQVVNIKKPNEFRASYRDCVNKANNSEVRTDWFLGPEHSHISGVIYSTREVLFLEEGIGVDLILIKNPNAINPIGDELKNIPFSQIFTYCDGEIKIS